jgi:hypothetical protein
MANFISCVVYRLPASKERKIDVMAKLIALEKEILGGVIA